MSDTKKRKISCLRIFGRARSNSISKSGGSSRGKKEAAAVTATDADTSCHDSPPSRSLSMHSMMGRSKSTDSLVSIASADVSFTNSTGLLDTFAKISTTERVRRRHSGNQRFEKMILTPYFGHFAGQRIHFDLKRNTEFRLVNIKVRLEDQVLGSLVHRQGKSETVRDQCIKFAHEITTPLVSRDPLSLSFLCEQTIILNLSNIPYWLLPPRYKCQFKIDCQTVRVHVFPSSDTLPITMKLKRNISVREVQWMLSKKLHLNNPSAISLYVKDSLETLPAVSSVPENVSELVCIIAPSVQQLRGTVDQGPLSICVSLIGIGVKEIQVYHSTTLSEFEQTIRAEFELSPDSFLYLPDVLSEHNGSYNSHCPLRMHALLDHATNTAQLLDHHKRSFPTLHGHLTVSNQQTLQSLLLYHMTVSQLDLLKSGPVVCFEVKGPTIPIALKTVNALENDADFCVIDIRPHAVSVNPDWSIPVLLKYLTCVSGFPCNVIKIGERVLHKTVYDDLLQREWFTIRDNCIVIPANIPCAQHS